MRAAAVAVMLLMTACGSGTIDRTGWQDMSLEDRTLYVRSLIGEEQARSAKGGAAMSHLRPAEEYVALIDAAYASGDTRTPPEIFQSFAAPR